MSSDVIIMCEQLKSIIGSKDNKKACTLLDSIDRYFDDRISENEIDLAVAKVFSEDGGVLGFMKLCLKNMSQKDKPFHESTIKSFDLFIKIIKLYPQKVDNCADIVVIICLEYIRSMITSAKEKERAGSVIETLISEKCCSSVDRTFLMNELLRVVEISKNSGTVQSRIFGLIGCLAKDYPDCIENVVEDGMKIRDIFFKALENVVVNKQNTTLIQLTGAFNGLNDFMEHFGPSDDHKEHFSTRLYKCIKQFSNPLDAKQKGVFCSALTLLAKRCEVFRKEVFDDFYYWHDLLVNVWLKMDSFDSRRPAILLLHALHREIAICLLEIDDSERCCQIFDFLQSYFKSRLESSQSQPFEVRLAIVGFGLIAAPCKKLLSREHLNELLRLVMQRTESAANAVNHHRKEQLEHFPDYVEALSLIMEQVDHLSGTQLNVLQSIVVAVIKNFHLLSTAHHDMTINTLMRTFHNLSLLGDSIVDDVIEKVIYQGIIWTCSHKLPIDARYDWDADTNWTDQVTFVSYLPLWNGFLAEIESSSYNRTAIVGKIYDHMMNSLFKILNKLNLKVEKRKCCDDQGNELFFSDPNYDLQPVFVKDFHIFFNLVGFYHDVLKAQSIDSHKTNFLKWINQFTEEVISKSLKHPLVSGFERLMQLILSISNRLDYFGNELYEDSQINYNDVYYYLTKTIKKSQQSYGELQIACLKLLFTSPASMLRRLIHDMIPAFQIAFHIGKSNATLFIAGMALSTIERYLGTVDRTTSDAKEFLCAVLPYFDAYLQGFKNDLVQSVEVARKRVQGTKRTAQKLIKVKENDLLKFQKRIILFLGTLEPEYCQHVIQHENANLVKWNTSKIVCLTLYGRDSFNTQIYMDTLIPRICEIATSTTDRQKKMTACEIIQATILYLIGSNNHRGKLWSELCKLMLELGCDGDIGIRQIFEPLVNQTMHYMSRPDQQQMEGNRILLKCLMDAISHPTNLSVRDLASRSLREFLIWTYNQRESAEQSNASPFQIDALIKQLKMFNSDALHQKRFGAALAFNNIYRELRKAYHTTDKYWLDFLHDFCINFKLSEQQMEENLNCPSDLDQVSASLDHVERVLREQNQIFNEPNPNRITTPAYTGSLLLHAVLWLLGQTNSTQNMYRKKVMAMFIVLAPCVDTYNSAAMFIRSTYDLESVIELCDNKIDIEYFDNRRVIAMYTWLKKLRTSLDCYIWFIQNDFMPNHWKEIFGKSNIFRVLEHYINNILNKNQFADDHHMDAGTIAEMEKINMEKSAILLLMLQFLNKTIAIDCVPDGIWQRNELIWMIETSIFRPQCLECDSKNPEFLAELPKVLRTFIINVNRSAVEPFKTELNDKLVRSTTEIFTNLTNSIGNILNRSSISITETNNLKGVDLIYSLIKTKDISTSHSLNTNIDVLATDVLYKMFAEIKECQGDDLIAKSLSPDTLKFTKYLLQVSFHKNQIFVNLIDLLLNTTELTIYDSQKTIKQGKHFLNLYKSTIYKYLLKSVDNIIERLIVKMLPPNVSYVLQILSELIEYAYKAGQENIPQMKLLTNILLGNWHDILARTDGHVENKTKLIDLMEHIAMICPYELTYISEKAAHFDNWLLSIINNDVDTIDTKCQAIFLLPCVIGPATNDHQEIQNALEKIQENYFPLYTSELRPGSVNWNTFENTFQVILDTMCTSQSFVVLKFIINCSAPDADHIMDRQIVQSTRKFMSSLKPNHQLYCLNKVFEMFCGLNFDAAIRTVLMERFLSHMILSSTKDIVAQFYAENIQKIELLLETQYTLNMSDYKLEQAFTSRIGVFKLIEIIIMIFVRHEICDKNFPVLRAKYGNNIKKGNELLAWMTNKADSAKKETFQTTNAQHMEWFRKYQCAAYKALCSLISNTQTNINFYANFCFNENNWRYMINTTDPDLYTSQTLEVDKRPQIKERMVSIRRLKENDTVPNRKYIETQNVFESSLSQDVTKIDLSTSYLRTADEVERQVNAANYQPKTLMLERNSVNDHEIMAVVCGVIDHIFENDIASVSSTDWFQNINKVIANSDVHMNIRIFLVTAIDNCSKRFNRCADYMTPAILKFLIDWTTLKGSIDALTVFLLVDVLEWSEITNPINEKNKNDMQNLATKLMANLMAFANSQQRDVLRRNLELIRNLMERWREFIEVPHEILYETITDKNIESKVNACGLHLNGFVIANNLIPWTTDESRKRFIIAIIYCLNNNHSEVYQPAAELLGMVLNQIIVKQNNRSISKDMEEVIRAVEQRLNDWKFKNEKKFMYVLYHIDKRYVIHNSGLITTITNLMSKCTSDMKKYFLQMFLNRVNGAEPCDIQVFLSDLNHSQEYQHQLLGLHIFNKALPKLTAIRIQNMFPRIALFHDAKQSEIRDVVYEIMKYVRGNLSENLELKQKATEILLKGLNDVDKNLQITVFKYWDELPEMPTSLNDRVLFMLQHLYFYDFLQYGVQLLIHLNAADLKKEVFPTLAKKCDYDEYDINVHWKSQDSTLRVPLFTESQQKQLSSSSGEFDPTLSYLQKKPHSLNFEPTLDPSTLYRGSDSFSLQSQNSLLFGDSSLTLDRQSQQVQSKVQPFGPKTEEEIANRKRNKFSYLRERILRNKDVVSRERALSAVRRRDYKEREVNQQQKRKEGQVTLYRRYRFGTYPDFAINSLAFLLPLQVLVKLDVILARNTFVTILNAVYNELNEEIQRDFSTELTYCIENLIRQSNQCDPMLFSALTEIAMTNQAELKIEPGLATAIPNANNMMINAILLLENSLMTTHDTKSDGYEDVINKLWAEMANMYYNLSEFDVASSIFCDKIQSDQLQTKAIEFESNGDYNSALHTYIQSIEALPDDLADDSWEKLAQNFSYQSLFNCYEEMGRWEDLEDKVNCQLKNESNSQTEYEELWTDDWNMNYLLQYYIRSEVRTLIYNGSQTQTVREFLSNIGGWLHNPTRAEHIKKHFGEQLMMLHMANKDYLEAKVFSNQYFESFLSEWSATSVLSEKMRNNKLMNMRLVAEIHKYADLLHKTVDDGAIDDSVIAALNDRWEQTQMNKADSSQLWDALISYRIFVTEQALEKFQPKTAPIVSRLTDSMFDMQFKLNEIAMQQQNTELSNTVLCRLDTFSKKYEQNTGKSIVQNELAKVRHQHLEWMNLNGFNLNGGLENLVKIWKNLRNLYDFQRDTLDANPDIRIKLLDQFNEITGNASKLISEGGAVSEPVKKLIAELTESSDRSQNISESVGTFARRCCNETISFAEKYEANQLQMLQTTQTAMKENDIGESYYRLAVFSWKQTNAGSEESQLEVQKLLIKSILRGMRHNSKNARLQFPRLLQLKKINSRELTDLFNQEVKHVPVWNFLKWMTQIITNFDFEKPCFLDQLLVELAKTYPTSVIYSFNLIYQRFRERKPNARIRSIVRQIQAAIRNPIIEKFIEQINYVSLAEKVLYYHLNKILKLKDEQAVKKELQICYDNVYGGTRNLSTANISPTIKKDFEALMIMKHNQVVEGVNALIKVISSIKNRQPQYELSCFSEWLKEYHWYGGNDFIELPGQYTGNAPPNPNNILKIVKFNERVQVFSSLRCPIKMSAVCSDGKTYNLIVKYGEDVRQDERIQHIQELMSDQMKTDKNCSQQKLSLQTYKVIPLNTHCGIISWLENTDTISSLLTSTYPSWKKIDYDIRLRYLKFIDMPKNVSNEKDQELFNNVQAVLHYSHVELSKNMQELQSHVPQNMLRNVIYNMSASPECFYALRNNFTKSIAAMNVAHWILGIGDRHLDNFVIDMSNAQLIAIDFDMAFGIATRSQTVPELLPFRLTKQFVDVMQPLKTSGFLVKSMAHVLRTFRMDSESLMAALECFIRDPSSSNHIRGCDPDHLINAIKGKLNGINPLIPIENDLEIGNLKQHKGVIPAYIKLLKGSNQKYRHNLPKEDLTVEQQVKCLIDLATDPSVLGAAYIGFKPWC
ncbi:DNA-dependent protein kinase catalytic subunit-like [Contarinia nasturtii]|uniref:DNA-dependent protein kinase catalytic subunit-like n=1 Tax=Contarinia nasturtii TaxID=265458 RepID=UPI0012D4C28E|nr:DNA-dependent protein kinase catalytic subunit-like [Contarinia nasturtii]